jgi:hypothetical protein
MFPPERITDENNELQSAAQYVTYMTNNNMIRALFLSFLGD